MYSKGVEAFIRENQRPVVKLTLIEFVELVLQAGYRVKLNGETDHRGHHVGSIEISTKLVYHYPLSSKLDTEHVHIYWWTHPDLKETDTTLNLVPHIRFADMGIIHPFLQKIVKCLGEDAEVVVPFPELLTRLSVPSICGEQTFEQIAFKSEAQSLLDAYIERLRLVRENYI